MRRAYHFRSSLRGFTLLELVIVIVLLGFIAAVGSQMIGDTMRTSFVWSHNTSTESQGRYAVERMARELREMAFAAGGYDISSWSSTAITFNKEDGTAVTISSSGTTLTLVYNPGATATLTDQLSSGTFALTYLDLLGGTVSDKEDVRAVQIAMTLANPTTGKTESFRNRVFLRNAQASP